jgi:hypothetical protein
MRDSALGRLARAARHPPLWARWVLTILAFVVLIFAIRIAIHDGEGATGPSQSERTAEVEANRVAQVVQEEDQAPHTAPLHAGLPPRVALERAIAADARGRIEKGELTGRLQSVHCNPPGAPHGGRRAFRCTATAAGVAYPFLAVADESTRQLTWCKVDPPPVSGAPEVPVSPRCRV